MTYTYLYTSKYMTKKFFFSWSWKKGEVLSKEEYSQHKKYER